MLPWVDTASELSTHPVTRTERTLMDTASELSTHPVTRTERTLMDTASELNTHPVTRTESLCEVPGSWRDSGSVSARLDAC